MAFKFKMQKVLDYRSQLEEEAKVRLADAQARLDACSRQLRALEDELAAAEEKAAGEALQAADFWLHDQYIKGLKADKKVLAMQERMLAQLREEARQHLAACAVDRKVLEKLSEKHKIQYYRAEQKQELNFNDEIATIRHKAPALETD
ncbi:MAG: flagellar export protein FliJ [Desulfovibrio sp.]|nr:flagellar export protein FliJ [Desulfovibrio sp.]